MEKLNKIKWLGHASFIIEAQNCTIYIDPWKLKPNLPKADLILVTHEHFDHCSKEDIEKILKQDTIVVCNASTSNILSGIKTKIVHPKDKITVKNINIQIVAAYNINKSFHPKNAEGLGFVIETSIGKIYHCGDTDFIPEMKNIKCDIALLAVSGTYVMTAKEAAEAAKVINPKIAIPMHYGDIVGTINDAYEFCNLLKNTNIKTLILQKE